MRLPWRWRTVETVASEADLIDRALTDGGQPWPLGGRLPWDFMLVQAREPGAAVIRRAHAEYRLDDMRPPVNPIVSFLGPRMTNATLADTEAASMATPEELDVLRFVRAWPVPAVLGASVIGAAETDLPDALIASISVLCPGVTWGDVDPFIAPLRKYGMIHTSIAAGVDAATGQPMEVELYAEFVRIGVNSTDVEFSIAQIEMDIAGETDRLDRPLDGPFAFRVAAATWANVRMPGVGMPFYI